MCLGMYMATTPSILEVIFHGTKLVLMTLGLRYIGHNRINNAETVSTMDYLFIPRFRHPYIVVPWPGLMYNIGSDEAAFPGDFVRLGRHNCRHTYSQ